MYKKLIVVTRKTRLQALVERFNTRSQARFYIEHAGGDFADYEREDEAYQRSLDVIRRSLDFELPQQLVDRSLVPTFRFQKEDLVVTLGQDGLVANTAKYVGSQPIVAINPEPLRFDGVLAPFAPDQARVVVADVMEANARIREITLAEVILNDGQPCWRSMTCLSAPAAMFPPCTGSSATRNRKHSPRAACWFPPAPGRRDGFLPHSTWLRAWPSSAGGNRDRRFACHGKTAVCCTWCGSRFLAAIPKQLSSREC